jgi:hypothetical protein
MKSVELELEHILILERAATLLDLAQEFMSDSLENGTNTAAQYYQTAYKLREMIGLD